jgi:3-oxoacyl-[acyl-carrier-protein] synthase III
MLTDSVNLTDVGIKAGTQFAISTLEKAGWSPASCDHLIMHQTSKLSLNSAKKEINQLLDGNYFHDENTINNLEHRGNTASTSHMLALADQLVARKIQTGDKMVFSVTASGLTVGAGLYVFDDLPTRMSVEHPQRKIEHPLASSEHSKSRGAKGVFIESVGIADQPETKIDTLELLQSAALNCLARSRHTTGDIELLIFCGVYRTEYILEPAIAALLAGKLEMNATNTGNDDGSTLAFDIFNGAVGMMNALHIAKSMMLSGNFKTAMIVTAEIENNAVNYPEDLIGIRETGSALILSYKADKATGFSDFEFSYNTDAQDSYAIHSTYASSVPQIHYLNKEVSPNLEALFIESIVENVEQLFIKTGIQLDDLHLIIPPQISPEFIDHLSQRLGVPKSKMIDVSESGKDLFTSSVPYGFNAANAKPGDIGLFITVGSGIQVASALYHF